MKATTFFRQAFLLLIMLCTFSTQARADDELTLTATYDYANHVLKIHADYSGRYLFYDGTAGITLSLNNTQVGRYFPTRKSESEYEVPNLELTDGFYTLWTTDNTFRGQSDLLPKTSCTFWVCGHTNYINGYCSICNELQQPSKENGVYQIANVGNLYAYAQNPDAPAILINDIVINENVLDSNGDLTPGEKILWTPFSSSKDFDGNGHSISGLYVNTGGAAGLFSVISYMTIKNLTIKDSYIRGGANVGGIAGQVHDNSVFIGCHNAATLIADAWVSDVSGICGVDTYNEAQFISCLNTGKLYSQSTPTNAICDKGIIKNCLCLEGTATNFTNLANQTARSVTAEELRNGTAILQLNEGFADDALIWYQKLGTDDCPHTYTNGDDIVYGGFEHGSSVAIAYNNNVSGSYHHFPFNSNGTTEETGGHGYSVVDGVCQVCHITCAHDSYTNGVCNSCHYHCPHVFVNGFNDGNCSICGMDMTGVYEPAPKAADGFYEVSNGGQLIWVSHHMGSFRLMNDIVVNENLLNADGTVRDASSIKHKMADNKMPMYVTVDGCGHTISGLYGKYFIGEWLRYGTIKNLGIVDSWFEVATIAKEISYSQVKNFYTVATVQGCRVSTSFYNSTIDNCFFAGKNSATTPAFDTIRESSLLNLWTSGYQMFNTEVTFIPDVEIEPSVKTNCNTSITQKEFASGRVAYDMNQASTEGKMVWFQTLGVDEHPVLTSNGKNSVYMVTDCQNNQSLSNVGQDELDEDKHYFEKTTGVCIFCGSGAPGHQNPEDGYYEIETYGDLCWFRAEAQKNPAINGRLMNDIVMNPAVNVEDKSALHRWSSISDFKGIFDGQHHTISGLYGESLFDLLMEATVSNLGIVDYILVSGGPVLAESINKSTIKSCYAYNTLLPGHQENPLVNSSNNSTIDGCYVFTSRDYNSIVKTSRSHTTILNSCVLSGQYSKIVINGDATMSNCGVLTAGQFADGTATWMLNGGRYDGEQSYYQRLEEDNHPIFVKTDNNAIYGIPDLEGEMWYQNINPVDGHSVIFDNNDYVCVFDQAPVYSPLDKHDYMTLTAIGRPVTIGMRKTGSPENFKLQYAAKEKTWNTVELSGTNTQILTIAAGDTIYFRRPDDATISAIAKSSADYWSFTMEGEGMIEVNGNILSLLDKKVSKNSTFGDHAFENLFNGCEQLTVAPSLPFTQLKPYCYAQMFEGTGIRKAPVLPATQIPEGAYMGMFQNCKELTQAPELPATKLGCQAYANMFNGCEKINVVKLPDTQFVDYDDTEEKAPLRNWLAGTASVGKLVVSYEMSQNSIVAQNKPSGWKFPTYFFKEVKISTDKDTQTALNRLRNEGYIPLEKDLNEDTRSGDDAYDVYLGYKFTYDPTEAITQLMVIDKSQDDIVHDRQWLTTPYTNYGGKDFYLCPYYGDDKEGACLNRGRHHEVRCLSLFYSKTGNTNPDATFYTSIDRVLRSNVSGSKLYVPWLTYGGQYFAHCDTNSDYEGDNFVRHHTLEVTKEAHSHSYTAIFNWSDDRKSCFADMTCIECGATTNNVACSMSSKQLVAPSCVELGVIRYTATVTIEEQTFTDYTESTYGELQAHNYCQKQTTEVYLKDASTCTEAATYWYKCATCDNKSTTEFYTSEEDKDKPLGHSFDNNASQEDPAFYTCNVCGYEDHCRKTNLSFTAVGADMTIGMTKTGTPEDYVLQYSPDMSTWTTVNLTATNSNIVVIPAGKTYYFRHGSTTATKQISRGDSHYWSFTMDGSGTVEAGGNIMSLLDATCQQTELPMQPQHVFTKLFYNCEKLTVAPRMDAITAVPQWGFVSMFAGSGIKAAPALSATYIRDGAYSSMFENCKELVSVPALPATNLNRCAYWNMFKGCDKLTSIEIANIESMVADEGSTGRENSFHDMLVGTAVGTIGVMYMPDAMVGSNDIHLPENWNVQSIDGHHFVPETDEEGNTIWEWDGVTKATLKLVCTKNPLHKDEHVFTGDEITSEVTTQTSCTVDGVRAFTVSITIDGVEYKSTKEDVEPAPGHNYQYGVCQNCGDSPSHFDEFTITDGDPYIITHPCEIGSLTYSRFYPENVWSAWFTPFDVNASHLKANGLTPAYIEGIHNYDDNEDGTIDRTVMEIVKISNGRLMAGTPLLVRASEGYSEKLELSDVTMKTNSDVQSLQSSTTTSTFNFIGTYAGTTAAATDNFYSLNNSGTMVHRTGTILPLRWYCQIEQKPSFIGEETSTPAHARAIYIKVIGEEDQVTGIRTLYDEADKTLERADGIFDLSGRKFSAPQHGKINIVNGKKQYVR